MAMGKSYEDGPRAGFQNEWGADAGLGYEGVPLAEFGEVDDTDGESDSYEVMPPSRLNEVR
jgi:hypothetical protein